MPLAVAVALSVILYPFSASGDTIYVWSYDGSIEKFTQGGVGSGFANTGSSYNGSVGLAVDRLGNLYAGNPSNSIVTKFTPDGAGSFFHVFDSVSGLAFNSTGELFGTSPNFSELIKFPPLGDAVSIADSRNSKLDFPLSIAFDAAGNLYAANHGSPFSGSGYANTIEKFSQTGLDLGTFAMTGLNKPWGLAFDRAGNLFVSNSGNNTIEKFTPGGVGSVFWSTGLDNPQGLAFDSAGNLYVVNTGNNTVRKIRPNGLSSIFASGLNSPSSIAIARDVPEPSTWVLLVLGPLILAAYRRRSA